MKNLFTLSTNTTPAVAAKRANSRVRIIGLVTALALFSASTGFSQSQVNLTGQNIRHRDSMDIKAKIYYETLCSAQKSLFNSEHPSVFNEGAQPLPNNKTLLWASLSAGEYPFHQLGGDLKATYVWSDNSLSAKWSSVEYGIYYGKVKYNDWALVRVAAGPSYFFWWQNEMQQRSFGIGGEVEGMLKFLFIGIGAKISVMAVPGHFETGYQLTLNLGKLN